MPWKNILFAMLGIFIPMLYTSITTKFPTFPLSEADLVTLLVWIVGMIIGGWNIKSISIAKFTKRR